MSRGNEKNVDVSVDSVRKPRGLKTQKAPEMWQKPAAMISICERSIVMEIKRQLYYSHLHTSSPSSLCNVYYLTFSFLQLFICRVEKGNWIDDSPARLHRHTFSKPKLGILSLLSTFTFTFPSLNIYKSFWGRIKACIQGDEWFNLDSNCIKWANRNSWQKLYDGEVITCRLLPYCRRWEWSAGLVYRSNCMTQCGEWETDMGGRILWDLSLNELLCMIKSALSFWLLKVRTLFPHLCLRLDFQHISCLLVCLLFICHPDFLLLL